MKLNSILFLSFLILFSCKNENLSQLQGKWGTIYVFSNDKNFNYSDWGLSNPLEIKNSQIVFRPVNSKEFITAKYEIIKNKDKYLIRFSKSDKKWLDSAVFNLKLFHTRTLNAGRIKEYRLEFTSDHTTIIARKSVVN
jgi:hypothetical protein